MAGLLLLLLCSVHIYLLLFVCLYVCYNCETVLIFYLFRNLMSQHII